MYFFNMYLALPNKYPRSSCQPKMVWRNHRHSLLHPTQQLKFRDQEDILCRLCRYKFLCISTHLNHVDSTSRVIVYKIVCSANTASNRASCVSNNVCEMVCRFCCTFQLALLPLREEIRIRLRCTFYRLLLQCNHQSYWGNSCKYLMLRSHYP